MYTKDSRHANHHLRTLRNDFTALRDKATETRDAISSTATYAKNRAERALTRSWYNIKDQSDELHHNVVSYIRKNPIKAVGYGVLAGFLINVLRRK
ncbi:MAG: hypothetical protein P4M12_08135 [Gammaproteobacteria bacterium]|nr:hypothetical protein [Gammaproteobacteria bacterium]